MGNREGLRIGTGLKGRLCTALCVAGIALAAVLCVRTSAALVFHVPAYRPTPREGKLFSVCQDNLGTVREPLSSYSSILYANLFRSWSTVSAAEFYPTGYPCLILVCVHTGVGCDGVTYGDRAYTHMSSQPRVQMPLSDLVHPDRTHTWFTVVHEFGHALGFIHEETRHDYPDDIHCGGDANPARTETLYTAVDESSVMLGCGRMGYETFWDQVGAQQAYGKRALDLSALTAWQSADDTDYATVSFQLFEEQAGQGYEPVHGEGWIWDVQVPGTVELNLYVSDTAGDYYTGTSAPPGYIGTGITVGYLYTDELSGLVELVSYSNGPDYLTTTDADWAESQGYSRVNGEGYVFEELPYSLLHFHARLEGMHAVAERMVTAVGSNLYEELNTCAMAPELIDCNSHPTDPNIRCRCPSWAAEPGIATRIPGAVLNYEYDELPGTILLKTYYSPSLDEFRSCALSCPGDESPGGDYVLAQNEGYVFEDYNTGSALRLWWSEERQDYYTAATHPGGYTDLGLEGYGLRLSNLPYTEVAGVSLWAPYPYYRYALYATNSLRLNDRASVRVSDDVFGRVANTGSAFSYFGVETEVGEIVSVASVELRNRAQVYAHVTTEGSVALADGAEVHGLTVEESSVELPSLEEFSVEFPTDSLGDVWLEPGQASAQTTLAPARRGKVMVKPGTVLTLEAGDHYFDELVNEGEIRFQTATGPVRVYVANVFQHKGSVLDLDWRVTGDVFVGYFGSQMAPIEAPFVGTIVAPEAKLNLASVSEGFSGAFFAKDIEVHQDATVWYEPFIYRWGGSLDASSQCGNGVVESGEECDDGNTDNGDGCDSSCQLETGGGSCSEATALDLGYPGSPVTVAKNSCVKVQAGYPSWWGTRNMQLQSMSGGTYPVPFTWSSACTGASGEGLFSAEWQSQTFGPTSNACATVIDLQGAGDGSITIRYYAN